MRDLREKTNHLQALNDLTKTYEIPSAARNDLRTVFN